MSWSLPSRSSRGCSRRERMPFSPFPCVFRSPGLARFPVFPARRSLTRTLHCTCCRARGSPWGLIERERTGASRKASPLRSTRGSRLKFATLRASSWAARAQRVGAQRRDRIGRRRAIPLGARRRCRARRRLEGESKGPPSIYVGREREREKGREKEGERERGDLNTALNLDWEKETARYEGVRVGAIGSGTRGSCAQEPLFKGRNKSEGGGNAR